MRKSTQQSPSGQLMLLATPFIAASTIILVVAGAAIISNYQGSIEIELTKEGVRLEINQ